MAASAKARAVAYAMLPGSGLTRPSALRSPFFNSGRALSFARGTGKSPMFGLSIRTLLMGLFGLMVLVVLGLGAFALSKISVVNDNTVELARDWMPLIATARQLG
jgi:hypothetical protein